jgi:5'-3' exonuclease
VYIHLVDGTYELFRAYYGSPGARGADGAEVGAARTLGRSLLALLKDPEVTHVACAFDHVIESFRNDLFPGYKTSEGVEPALLSQFELAERVSSALGIVTWPMVEWEADDALATAAGVAAADPAVDRVLLCSPDKDLAQCVERDRVVLLDRMRKKQLDESAVVDKFGVSPAFIPDYLALVGDTADGIPGVPGFGPKTAALLIRAHGHLEEILGSAPEWTATLRGGERLRQGLLSHADDVLLYRRLATLRRDVPIDGRPEALGWAGPDVDRLRELCRDIGDGSLYDRAMEVADVRRARN